MLPGENLACRDGVSAELTLRIEEADLYAGILPADQVDQVDKRPTNGLQVGQK